MTKSEIELKIKTIEASIKFKDFTRNHILILAGEWHGLKQAIGDDNEGPWAMLHRVKGI